MNLTAEQEKAVEQGKTVPVVVAGRPCVVLRKDIYDHGDALDYGPWTPEELDLLAAETANLLAGDGFDEPDDT